MINTIKKNRVVEVFISLTLALLFIFIALSPALWAFMAGIDVNAKNIGIAVYFYLPAIFIVRAGFVWNNEAWKEAVGFCILWLILTNSFILEKEVPCLLMVLVFLLFLTIFMVGSGILVKNILRDS